MGKTYKDNKDMKERKPKDDKHIRRDEERMLRNLRGREFDPEENFDEGLDGGEEYAIQS